MKTAESDPQQLEELLRTALQTKAAAASVTSRIPLSVIAAAPARGRRVADSTRPLLLAAAAAIVTLFAVASLARGHIGQRIRFEELEESHTSLIPPMDLRTPDLGESAGRPAPDPLEQVTPLVQWPEETIPVTSGQAGPPFAPSTTIDGVETTASEVPTVETAPTTVGADAIDPPEGVEKSAATTRAPSTTQGAAPTTSSVPPQTSMPMPSLPTADKVATDSESEAVRLINQSRAAVGQAPLEPNGWLTDLARIHAAELAAAGLLRHQDLGVPLSWGFTWVGENVGYSTGGVADAHRALESSPGHLANMRTAEATHVGVGIAPGPDGRIFVVQLFASGDGPANRPPTPLHGATAAPNSPATTTTPTATTPSNPAPTTSTPSTSVPAPASPASSQPPTTSFPGPAPSTTPPTR